jgi:uncharacterized membrane protein YtjA (UPF0391 family)
MAYWSAVFLLIAFIALVMGVQGIAGISGLAAGGLFLAALLLALFPLVLGQQRQAVRRPSAGQRLRNHHSES